MLPSHHCLVTIASPVLDEPFALASILWERVDVPRPKAASMLRGLDDLPPSVTIAHTRQLRHAILAMLLARRESDIETDRTELVALAQHIVFGRLVPFRPSLSSPRCLSSLNAISRLNGASMAVYSAQGAPVFVAEADGGVVAAGCRSAIERLDIVFPSVTPVARLVFTRPAA